MDDVYVLHFIEIDVVERGEIPSVFSTLNNVDSSNMYDFS